VLSFIHKSHANGSPIGVNHWQVYLWLFLICTYALLSLNGCAAQGGPSGGPEDKTGPLLIASTPPDGSVRVALTPTIEMVFSEPVDPRSIEGNLSVYPRLAKPPQINAYRRKVTIKLAEPLAANCTYVFSFGRDLRDYQNNPSPAEVKLAIATGDSLNEGIISGKIYSIPPNTVVRVYLFRWTEDQPDSLVKAIPDFITTTDAQGEYQFTNLPPGRYRALAATSKSWRALSSEDYIAVPVLEPLALANRTDQIRRVDFRLSKMNWHPFKLLTANSVNGRIELNFAHEIDETSLSEARIELTPPIQGALHFWRPEANPKQLIVAAADLSNEQVYQLAVTKIRNIYGQPLIPGSVTCLYKAVTDTMAPTIINTRPKNNSRDFSLSGSLRLDFSEPLDNFELSRDIILLTSDSIPVPLTGSWLDANSLELRPLSVLRSNTKYQLYLNTVHWRDLSGNTFRDSSITIRFNTVDADQFGVLTGKITLPAGHSWQNIYVEASPVGSQEISARSQLDSLGNYRLENLLSGQYRLAIWEDRNSNAKFDYGAVIPYQPAEIFRLFPAAVDVRARWETAEVNGEF